ncbi:MAG: hypothetical protein M1826_001034 [Phylliscum demangeonii]|nr:MAG: hypothetical protein M1826_001034 [Phylliscum demangeonii]
MGTESGKARVFFAADCELQMLEAGLPSAADDDVAIENSSHGTNKRGVGTSCMANIVYLSEG